jgi:predicted nucleic acid-binding protein
VEALGRSRGRGASALRARAITRFAQREGVRPIVPVAVLAEVYRGDRSDAGIDRLVRHGADLLPLSLGTARLAGRLRRRAGRGSAVDAIVVATAVRLGGGVIATADREDLAALAMDNANVRVWSLNQSHP